MVFFVVLVFKDARDFFVMVINDEQELKPDFFCA